ncbi:MAG TPA: hypothetical protein VI077_13150 [Pseudolabrys sp.]|jgi:hypothetical protein
MDDQTKNHGERIALDLIKAKPEPKPAPARDSLSALREAARKRRAAAAARVGHE